MTAVIGLPLAYMLKMRAESKDCALSVITCTNHISATQEATSVTLQISTKAGFLMKTSGTVVSYANGFSFIFFSHNSPSMQLLVSHLFSLNWSRHDLIKVACHFLVNIV